MTPRHGWTEVDQDPRESILPSEIKFILGGVVTGVSLLILFLLVNQLIR